MKKSIERIRRAIRRMRYWGVQKFIVIVLRRSLVETDLAVDAFSARIAVELSKAVTEDMKKNTVAMLSRAWRQQIRTLAGLPTSIPTVPKMDDLGAEMAFLMDHGVTLAPVFKLLAARRVLFSGQAYYNSWYLSRALRAIGWKADLYNWDEDPATQIYYHGEDFRVGDPELSTHEQCVAFYLNAVYGYDIFHFSNTNGISFGWRVAAIFNQRYSDHSEIAMIKTLGKVLVYSNNGCLDGVSQTAFSKWKPESPCTICRWQHEPSVCSDQKNFDWGRFRNSVIDYQCLLGGNRVDFNDDPSVHEVPEFYCLDPQVWDPVLEIPVGMRLPEVSSRTIRLYHAVGHKADRTRDDGVNIKSSHVYLPLIEKLQGEGMSLELIEPTGIPNKDVRFLQMQADIFLDMLSYGWFGANAREAMMLAKPVICYIRPEWLESLREEIPEYAEELPIISASPDTVEQVLRDLIVNPDKRREIGERSRHFAIKWHSSEAGGKRFDEIYSCLMRGDKMLR